MQKCRQSRATIVQSVPELADLKQKCRDQRMLAALDFLLAQDLTCEFQMEELCRHLNLSTSHVLHLFHETFGYSPLQVLKLRKMQEARQLLASSFKNIKEIRATVGLSDPSHFGRDFARLYGESPSKFRKRLAEEALRGNVDRPKANAATADERAHGR